LSAPREAAVYAVALAILLLAAQADGLPASLGVLGLAFALMGMGAGMRGLYRFLYGTPFLQDHPGVVRRDTARWQRLALVGSVACLVAGLVLALVGTDVAGGH